MNNKYYKQLGKRRPRFYNFPQMFKWQWRQRFLRETSMVKKNSVYTVQKVSISISRFYLAHLWIRDQIVETLFSTGVTSENKTIRTPPPIPSSQCWGGCCFVQVAGTVAQHCVEGVGWEKLCFPKIQRGSLVQSVSTKFVADCRSVQINSLHTTPEN